MKHSQFSIRIDSETRSNYGVPYPITYKFSIPSDSANLSVYIKRDEEEEWVKLDEKISNDFFNGEEVVRFEYDENFAYVSVKFGGSDEILLRFENSNGELVNDVNFIENCKYYDNRKCALIYSGDDWYAAANEDFKAACDVFTQNKVWLSAGIETAYNGVPAPWVDIQEKIDAGYIDPVSHSKSHVDPPYEDVDDEVGGSQAELISNLDFPKYNKNGSKEFMVTWIAPGNHIDDEIREALGRFKYLCSIQGPYLNSSPPSTVYGDYPEWNETFGIYSDWNGYQGDGKTAETLNARFNEDYNNGAICHIRFHPWSNTWNEGDAFPTHLAYVSQKKDVWYAGLNHLFSYHYPIERELITVKKILYADTISISENLSFKFNGSSATFIHLKDKVEINDKTINIKFCEENTVKSSKYGTFKYGQRKYGKNITVCEEKLKTEVERILIKFNDGYLLTFDDKIDFFDSSTREIKYYLNLSDSQPINESFGKEWNISIFFDDSIFFADGKARYITINLFDNLPIETLIEINFEETPLEKSNWKFIIRDNSGKNVASLVNARKRWFVQRLNDESEAGFILDADDDNCNSTILNLGVNELYIYYKEVLMWSGQLVSAKKIASGDDIYWEVFAKDWVSLLGKRFVGVDKPLEYTTTDAGEIAWDLIDTTQNEVYGDFGITRGTIQPSITRSPVYDRKNILEAIKELSNQGDESSADTWGFDFEITPKKVFNVYYPYMGTVRQGVVFRYPGNCENFEALVDSWTIVNHEWGFGKHWTGNDAVVERSDAASQAIYKRREKLKSYSDVSVLAFLQDMVWQDIQWLKEPSQIIRFDARVDEKVKITDYNVGDGVVVVNDKFDIDELLWVFERKVEIDENDELSVRLTVGD